MNYIFIILRCSELVAIYEFNYLKVKMQKVFTYECADLQIYFNMNKKKINLDKVMSFSL